MSITTISVHPDSIARDKIPDFLEQIDSDYQLILEGYPHPINLESSDAQNLKIILQSKLDQNTPISAHKSTWNQQEQLQKNQKAMAILAQRIA
ncbi:MAG: hypothetical protein ACK5GT_07800, partial [Aphanizomenon sp.]